MISALEAQPVPRGYTQRILQFRGNLLCDMAFLVKQLFQLRKGHIDGSGKIRIRKVECRQFTS